MNDLDWLRALEKDIWIHFPRTANSYGWSKPKRKLTEDEWSRVRDLASGLVCQMGNSAFGFEFALRICAIPADPPYPGVPMDEPEHLVTIAAAHLPWYEDDNSRSSPKKREDRSWDEFSAFTHSESNVAKLKELGMDAPKSKGYYEY